MWRRMRRNAAIFEILIKGRHSFFKRSLPWRCRPDCLRPLMSSTRQQSFLKGGSPISQTKLCSHLSIPWTPKHLNITIRWHRTRKVCHMPSKPVAIKIHLSFVLGKHKISIIKHLCSLYVISNKVQQHWLFRNRECKFSAVIPSIIAISYTRLKTSWNRRPQVQVFACTTWCSILLVPPRN